MDKKKAGRHELYRRRESESTQEKNNLEKTSGTDLRNILCNYSSLYPTL